MLELGAARKEMKDVSQIRREWSLRSDEQFLVKFSVAREVDGYLSERYITLTGRYKRFWEVLGWAKPGRKIIKVFSICHLI